VQRGVAKVRLALKNADLIGVIKLVLGNLRGEPVDSRLVEPRVNPRLQVHTAVFSMKCFLKASDKVSQGGGP
jgi:hypothetical protein